MEAHAARAKHKYICGSWPSTQTQPTKLVNDRSTCKLKAHTLWSCRACVAQSQVKQSKANNEYAFSLPPLTAQSNWRLDPAPIPRYATRTRVYRAICTSVPLNAYFSVAIECDAEHLHIRQNCLNGTDKIYVNLHAYSIPLAKVIIWVAFSFARKFARFLVRFARHG